MIAIGLKQDTLEVQTNSIDEQAQGLKEPLVPPLDLTDKVLQRLIETALKLLPEKEKRAILIETLSRSMPPGYIRLSFVPPPSQTEDTASIAETDQAPTWIWSDSEFEELELFLREARQS